MRIQDAVSQINQFKESSLADTVANIESSLSQVGAGDVLRICETFPIGQELLSAAADIKRASAQINVIIHAVGIIYSLPYILEETEVIESVSLGAGSANSGFDLVTDKQIAEFKFINWQGGSEAVRKKTLFEDYVKLAREDFVSRYGQDRFHTVRQFYAEYQDAIHLVNLTEIVPGIDVLIWEV